jgi:thymidine phosphorylase
MVASILAKKKTAGATHALLDIPLGPSTKVRTQREADELGNVFSRIARVIDLEVDVLTTDAHGPIGCGIGPRLEALDVLEVLRCNSAAPPDLREKSLFLAGRILERTGTASDACGYRTAREALDSGAAMRAFEAMVEAQGVVEIPGPATFRETIESPHEGRIRHIDCLSVNRIARLAGSPAHPAAGIRCLRRTGDVVQQGEPLFEIHAESRGQLDMALDDARACLLKTVIYGY